MAGFSFAHLSDPHLATALPRNAWNRLTLKQIVALSSWRRRRSRLHRMTALELLRDDVASAQLCHVVVTGDLVNLADAAEFPPALDWLAGLGPPDRVSVVSGNHDHLRRHAPEGGAALWRAHASGDSGEASPWVRRRGGVAGGRLGAAQIAQAGRLLRETAEQGLFRVVLMHHPPLVGPGGWRKSLFDRDALCAMLAREGAELLLHGHHHIAMDRESPGPAGPIPVLGVPSASSWPDPADPREPAGWDLHRVERCGDHWRLTTTARRPDPAGGVFVDAHTRERRIPVACDASSPVRQ